MAKTIHQQRVFNFIKNSNGKFNTSDLPVNHKYLSGPTIVGFIDLDTVNKSKDINPIVCTNCGTLESDLSYGYCKCELENI